MMHSIATTRFNDDTLVGACRSINFNWVKPPLNLGFNNEGRHWSKDSQNYIKKLEKDNNFVVS